MNAALYVFSCVALAVALALAAWSSPRTLWLPAFTRAILGLAATPLVLPVLTLAITLVWPGAPRFGLLAWPALVVAIAAGLRPGVTRRVLRQAGTRLRRMRIRRPATLTALAGVVLLFTAAATLFSNARPPLSEHDALIYFNEARVFAKTPAWKTFAAMANPAEPTALVSGHTHTWLFPTYIAQALLATDAVEPGAGHDFIARGATQAVLLALMLAVGALTFAVTRRSLWLTVTAVAGVAAVRWVAYITTATSIDAFRVLPLVLACTALVSEPRRRSGWITAAAFLAIAAAAHTLNIAFVVAIVAARLFAGFSARRSGEFWRTFVPAAALLMLPVAAHYVHLWLESGRLLGNGMHYRFYADSPLQAAATSGVLRSDGPTLIGVVRGLVAIHGGWCTFGLLLLMAIALPVAGPNRSFRFLSCAFVLGWVVLFAGVFVSPLRSLTWAMLDNFRYPIAIWILGLPVAAASVAIVGRRLPIRDLPSTLVHFGPVVLSMVAVWGGTSCIRQWWSITYNTSIYLDRGERWIAAEVARVLAPGETWMTDRNTVAYYSRPPPIFLYTPAGHRWIRARTADEAWTLICAQRVRLVAFNNPAKNWWPRTALYAALAKEGHADRRQLPSWEIFYVHLPPATSPALR